ncbi:unnamed protein product [Ectocarpus sp. 13 AM-2016]
MSYRTDRLERGHLDSEDSLLDEDHSVEMQNPLSVAPEAILVNFNNNANNPDPGGFSDDEPSSPESNKSPSRNNPSFPPSGNGGSDHGSSKEDDDDNRLDQSSECGSMAATMRHERAVTTFKGDEEEDSAEKLPPKAADMEDVDLGSTNRIMALRKTNDSSSTNNQNPERGGNCLKDETRTAMDPSTAEPSPNTIVPGDASQVDELSEMEYIAADGYGFDYVMVFKLSRVGVMTDYATETIKKIMAAGFKVRVYLSCSKEEVFCEMRASVERLMQYADQVNRKMLLDRFQLSEAAAAGDPEAKIAPIKINNDPNISFRSPYEYIYARYDRRPDLQHLYYKSDGMWHPFRAVVRLSISIDILKAPMCLGGAGLPVDKLKLQGKILALFPKHFKQNKLRLRNNWLVVKQWPWETPYDQIKDYYGEKIGLYFHFLGHLTTWLIPLGVAGLITAMTVYISGNEEHVITLIFAPIVVFWAIAMLEFWKRKEKRVALEWGMIGFENDEQARPEYKGEFIPSPIDGKTILYYPTHKKAWKSRRATAVIVSMVTIVVGCIAAVYAFRQGVGEKETRNTANKWYLVYGTSGDWGETWGGIVTSVINSIQIQVLNAVYKKVAVALTDFENHRTSTEYEDSLVSKLFCFTFCNSYGGFIYLAFIGEPVIGVACEKSCMSLLATNLTIVFVVQLVVGNLTEVLIPFIKYTMRVKAEKRGDGHGHDGVPVVSRKNIQRTQAEKGLYLEQYDPIMGALMDYAELAVQFGYITLFVVAFPLAPLLALANNYVEARSDAFKLLTQMQRPVPRGAEDIGSWQGVFTTISCIAVVTNSALICLIYEDLVGEYSLATRLWLFILFQWVAFIFMAGLGATVPDVPEDVTIQQQRTTFLSSKMVDKVADEMDDDMQKIDQAALDSVKVPISPAMSPKGEELHRGVHVA